MSKSDKVEGGKLKIKKRRIKDMKMKRIIALTLVSTLMIAGNVPEAQAAKKKSKRKTPKFTLVSTNTGATNRNVKIKVKLGKGVKVKQVLWKKGKSSKSANKYWKKAKNITKKKTFTATSNGWYSVRIKDKKNRVARKTIKVTNIDKTAPTIGSAYTVSNKIATISVAASDSQNAISYMGYAKGYLQETRNLAVYTPIGGATIPTVVPFGSGAVAATHQFTATEPGYYTICARDGVGNVSLDYVYVELWKDLTSLTPFDKCYGGPTEGAFRDRWKNTFTNPVGLGADRKEESYVEYFLNGAYTSFSGKIVRGYYLDDDEVVWVEIYADGNLVYTSGKMDYKNPGIDFDVNIANAKYIKIKAISDSQSASRYWDSSYAGSDGWVHSEGVYITDGKLYN